MHAYRKCNICKVRNFGHNRGITYARWWDAWFVAGNNIDGCDATTCLLLIHKSALGKFLFLSPSLYILLHTPHPNYQQLLLIVSHILNCGYGEETHACGSV